MRWDHNARFIIFIVFCLAAKPVHGGCVFRALEKLSNPIRETAVELEMDFNEKSLRLVTTQNEKVSGLIHVGRRGVLEELPEWFRNYAKIFHPGTGAYNVRWDDISPERQLRLIRDLSSKRKQKYSRDREIYGLVPRRKIEVTFKEPTSLMNTDYPAGKQTIDLSYFLRQDNIEYRGPEDTAHLRGVELHVRYRAQAGDASVDAWKLMDALGIERNDQHVHILGAMPYSILHANPEVVSAKMGDFVRRANLAAEFIGIVEDRLRVRTVKNGSIRYFDSLTPQSIEGITSYFRDVGLNKEKPAKSKFKMSWVGMRGLDKYDQSGVWGLEYRSVSERSNPETVRNVLSGLQSKMADPNYGIDKDRIEDWLRHVGLKAKKAPSALGKSWYNQSWEKLFALAQPEVRKEIGGLRNFLARGHLRKMSSDNREVKMLVHDWSDDPLIFDQIELQAKIASEQARALSRIRKGESINPVVADFIRNSGLYKRVLHSVGVDVRIPRP